MNWERQRTYDLEAGFERGRHEKAIEDAILLVTKYKVPPETAAADFGVSLEKLQESLKLLDEHIEKV